MKIISLTCAKYCLLLAAAVSIGEIQDSGPPELLTKSRNSLISPASKVSMSRPGRVVNVKKLYAVGNLENIVFPKTSKVFLKDSESFSAGYCSLSCSS